MYPLLFIAFPRLWSVSHRHGYVTAADFVRGRFDNRPLALAVALTGIIGTMPYIALQLVGVQVVIAGLGLNYTIALPLLGNVSVPLIAAFSVLAAYTYNSGLRGTALIAVVKDFLIYATVLAAVIVIPAELGGYAKIFASVNPKLLTLGHATANNLGPGLCLCHTLHRLDSGAVHVSPCGHGIALLFQPACGPAQRHGIAGLLLRPRR